MLIYRDLNDLAGVVPRDLKLTGGNPAPAARRAAPVRPAPADDHRELDEPEPLLVEEMDIPADADGGDPSALDELLATGPSLLDEMAAMAQPREPAPAPARQAQRNAPQRSYRPALSRRPGAQPAFGPGSMTRAIGVNDQSTGTNDFGDGRGNVLRDNNRHFGLVGTRSR